MRQQLLLEAHGADEQTSVELLDSSWLRIASAGGPARRAPGFGAAWYSRRR
jgi:hypothetical protein